MFSKLVDIENNRNSILHSVDVIKKDVYLEFIRTFPDPQLSGLMLRKYGEINRRGRYVDSRILENDIENVLVPYAKNEIYKKFGFGTQTAAGMEQLLNLLVQNLTKNKQATTSEIQTEPVNLQ